MGHGKLNQRRRCRDAIKPLGIQFLDPKGVKMAIFEKSLKNLLDGSINIICA